MTTPRRYLLRAPAGNGRQRRSLTGKSQLLSMAEALSRLIPNADCRLSLVIRHRQDDRGLLFIAQRQDATEIGVGRNDDAIFVLRAVENIIVSRACSP